MVFLLLLSHALGLLLAHAAQAPHLLVVVCLPTLPYFKGCIRPGLFSISRRAMLEQLLIVIVLGVCMCAFSGNIPSDPRWLSAWSDAAWYLLFAALQHTFYVGLIPLSLQRAKPHKVPVISAILFTAPHLLWGWGPLSTISTGILMWRWCSLALETGSLGASLVGHMAIGLLQRWFGFDL